MAEPPVSNWHTSTHTLRYSDNDPVGHVNNAVYATMFEAGRVELLDASGAFVRGGPLAAVIVRLEIDFRREMAWPGTVVVETAVSRFGQKSIHIRQRCLLGSILTAEGLSVLALIDRESRRAVPLDEEMRARFERWTLPGG